MGLSKQSHSQRLIDTFVNRIYLYDDKLIITFNHKDGAQTITLNDIETAFAEQEHGSFLIPGRGSNIEMQVSGGHLPGGGSTTPAP